MGTFFGVPMIRTIGFWGLYWGPPYFGKLPSKGTEKDDSTSDPLTHACGYGFTMTWLGNIAPFCATERLQKSRGLS